MNKFTVVIPTRERADTLFHTLKTCVAQDYDNLTILVSDNLSADNTEEVVKSFNDKRIQYIKTPKRLSMSANWDFALDHVSGGFVNYIGDDDGLIPDSFSVLNQILSEAPVDAVTSKDMAIYFWPGYVEDEIKGNLYLSLKPTYREMNTAKYFDESFAACNCIHLPQLYHGYVRTEILHQLKKKHGNFFNGPAPDIYSGVVLGKTLSKHVFSNYPLTIHGLSHHSIGSSNSFKHINNNPAEKFWNENTIPVHEKLEKSASMAIIYADAFLLARKYVPGIPEMNIKDVIRIALNEPVTEKSRQNRNVLLEIVKRIAEKNNLSDYASDLISKTTESIAPIQKATYGFNPVNEMLILKTTEIGIQNVYDAFLLAKNLLPKKVYAFYERPMNEGLVDYFLRGFRGAVKKIIK